MNVSYAIFKARTDEMIDILDTPRFLFADLSRVIDVEQNNLKGWLNRGAASFGPYDRDAGGSGKRRLLTLRTVYEFALAAHLVKLGLSPAHAFQHACKFSGRDGGKHELDTRNESTLLYDVGKTIFVIYPDDDASDMIAKATQHEWLSTYFYIGQFDKSAGDESLFKALFRDGIVASATLHCNPILQGVDKALEVRRG